VAAAVVTRWWWWTKVRNRFVVLFAAGHWYCNAHAVAAVRTVVENRGERGE
jgi:hypothetical protein